MLSSALAPVIRQAKSWNATISLRRIGLLLTRRWRGVASNHQFRESRHRCPHVDFSVEAAELVDLVGDCALTFAAAACDLVRLSKLIGAT